MPKSREFRLAGEPYHHRYRLPKNCNSDLCKSCEFQPIKHKCVNTIDGSSYIRRNRKTNKEIIEPYEVMTPHKIRRSARYDRARII